MRRAEADLRPLGTPELFDAALLLLARNAPRAYALSTAAALPAVLLTLGYYQWVSTLTKRQEGSYWERTALWSAAMAAAWLFLGLGRGALAAVALAKARGEPLAPRAAWGAALRRAPSLALATALPTVAVWLGAPLLLFPAFVPLTAWILARPVVMDEERPMLEGLRRSAALTRGYRGKALTVCALFALLWSIVAVDAYLLVQGVLGALNTMLGFDMSRWAELLSVRNRGYVLWLGAGVFLLLDPLKTCADVALYLDLRVRREGADLELRLRALPLAALLVLLLAGPAGAMPLEEYRAKVRELQRQVAAAKAPAEVDPQLWERLARPTVEAGSSQRVSVDNRWLAEGLGRDAAAFRRGKQELVRRLGGLERALGGRDAAAGTTVSPDQAYQQVIGRPEFQELAQRPEIGGLLGRLRPERAGTWFERLSEWIERHLLRTPRPQPRAPRAGGEQRWDPRLGRMILYGLLGLAAAILLAVLLRGLLLWQRERGSAAPAPAALAPLEESQTENALDHTPDEWEQFAGEWLRRGDLRQAVRALYLAMLVELHQRRRIDYDRARTNWHYVRHFAGPDEERQVLRGLTEFFDLAWYGRRRCSEEQFRGFAAEVRQLVGAGAHEAASHA